MKMTAVHLVLTLIHLNSELTNLAISVEGVQQLLSNIIPHKSSGPDQIPGRLLKLMAHEFAPSLSVIYQASLEQGVLPQDWRNALIVPIFKKGCRLQLSNYRPISLTCIVCKILEHIISTNMYQHLEDNHIICRQQHGFHKRRSCETQLISTIHDFATTLNNSGQTHAILLDLSKAFDTVPHKKLCHKLSSYGIRGQLLNWISAFLTGRCQRVVLNGEISQPCLVTSGVPQGSVLGPLLFLCYINDIPKVVKSNIKLYADDALLYRNINSEEDIRILQEDLNALVLWAKKWQMNFNPSKCECMIISNKLNLPNLNYCIDNIVIKQVEHAKYLGVTIDSKLKWHEHINSVVKKGNSVYGFLQRNLRNCPAAVKSYCYQTYLRPVLEYASIVWSPYCQSDIDKLEMVQRRSARFVMNRKDRYASVTNMMRLLGWPTLKSRRTNAKLIMLYKIINNIVDVDLDGNLLMSASSHNTRCHLTQQYSRVDAYKYSFVPSAIKLWNTLPHDIVYQETVNNFQNKLLTNNINL